MTHYKVIARRNHRNVLPEFDSEELILVMTNMQRSTGSYGLGRFRGIEDNHLYVLPSYRLEKPNPDRGEALDLPFINRGNPWYGLSHGIQIWTGNDDIVEELLEKGFEGHVSSLRDAGVLE